MTRIAVDAMGGDNAPLEIVEGSILANEDGVDVVLVGDQAVLDPLLQSRGADLPVAHASQIIEFDEDPGRAIRDKKDSSIAVASRMVAAGEAGALVSAGSTGAVMASATFLIGRLGGVSRPGIASIYPTGHVILDVGANLECKPDHLLQFAVMGGALAQVYLHKDNPTVGLINIGEEKTKGRSLELEAHVLMESSAAINFVGNVEGRDLATEVADVMVTDGFTGNVLLKTSEGVGKVIQQLLISALARPELSEHVQPLMPALMEMREQLSSDSVGGAHLVGTKGVVVIAHGSSSRIAIRNAIEIAAEGVDHGLVEKIAAGIESAEH